MALREPTRIPISPSLGVTHLRRKEHITHISFPFSATQRLGLCRLFERFGARNINVFFIKKTQDTVSLGIDNADQQAALECLEEGGIEAEVKPDCGVACVVASNMKYAPGLMYRIVRSLRQVGVPLLGTSDSFNSMSCLVKQEDLEKALEALGKEFGIQESANPTPLDPW